MGYFAGANILMEYVLSNAAVARTFTEYLSSAFGVHNSTTAWRVQVDGLVKGYDMLDFPAVALILLLTLCLCHRFDFLPYFIQTIYFTSFLSYEVLLILVHSSLVDLP